MTTKQLPLKRRITQKTIVASFLIVSLWWIFWLGSQALFMVDVPYFTDRLLSSDQYINFISLTFWIITVNLIALALYHWLKRDYRFLRIKDQWDIVAYLIPLALIILLVSSKATVFEVPIFIYIAAMIVTNFCQ